MAEFTDKGKLFHTNGDLPAVGSAAPDFRLVNVSLQDVTLATYAGRSTILNIVPSLDTRTCAASARKFNEKAASVPNAAVLVISADLPFAMKRFCATEGLNDVIPLSMMRGKQFAKSYGVLITDGPMEGIAARAVVVIDPAGRVVHAQFVHDLGAEPDYEAALAAIPK
jgi:thiol peroxidase